MASLPGDVASRYLDHFACFEKRLNGEVLTPLHAIRRAQIQRFAELGFPSRREEAWRFTNLAPLERAELDVASYYHGELTLAELAPYQTHNLDANQLVFVNGRFVEELSSPPTLIQGVRVSSLASALESEGDRILEHLETRADYGHHRFAALNTAFLEDGAYVHLGPGVKLEQPVHLLFLSIADEPVVSHPRVLVFADPGSRATIVEFHAGDEGRVYLNNSVTEIVAGDHSALDHYRIQRDGGEAFHLAQLRVNAGCASRVVSTAVGLGARLVRNDIHARLEGEGAEVTLNGLYVVGGQQHVDNHTLIEHVAANCPSHEFYKGILGGEAGGSFRGKIYVHRQAQQTDAYQSNQNLLLSDGANINSKPQLEIYADDVKCSHGSTVGQLDTDALFYLRSRGLTEATARVVLTRAFAGEVLERIRLIPLREALDKEVSKRLDFLVSGVMSA